MGMNPQEGDLRMITENFDQTKAAVQGYTDIFKTGELIRIRDCYFIVNNFVEEHNFMNLKLIKTEDALAMLSNMLPKAEILNLKDRFKALKPEV